MSWCWIPATKIPQLVEQFSSIGCRQSGKDARLLDFNTIIRELRSKPYLAVMTCRGIRTELFTPWHPFHCRVIERSPLRELEGRRIKIHSAEDLIIFKKIFDRPKDIGDIKAMPMAQKRHLDLVRLRADAKELLTDANFEELDLLLKEFG